MAATVIARSRRLTARRSGVGADGHERARPQQQAGHVVAERVRQPTRDREQPVEVDAGARRPRRRAGRRGPRWRCCRSRAGANGQPPRPPIRRRGGVTPGSTRRRVGVAGVAGVVQVQTERRDRRGRERGRHEPPHLCRDADADRVGEHDLVGARRRQPSDVLDDEPGVDPALERAAERGARA